jgi:long-subunit acyl-CoA synthetase (AMP-forming)
MVAAGEHTANPRSLFLITATLLLWRYTIVLISQPPLAWNSQITCFKMIKHVFHVYVHTCTHFLCIHIHTHTHTDARRRAHTQRHTHTHLITLCWQALPEHPALCDVEWVPAEHPLFLLYTSGSTGERAVQPPKGCYAQEVMKAGEPELRV